MMVSHPITWSTTWGTTFFQVVHGKGPSYNVQEKPKFWRNSIVNSNLIYNRLNMFVMLVYYAPVIAITENGFLVVRKLLEFAA